MASIICPECDREFVRRVSRQGLKERLMSLFYVYPFRCQLCRHRFYFLQKGVRYHRVYPDRREYERLAVNLPVWVFGSNTNCQGSVIDISIAGGMVKLNTPLCEGDLCRLDVYLPGDTIPVNVAAAVVRTVRDDQSGIEFLQFYDNERERLQLFIRGHLTSLRVPPDSSKIPLLAT